MRIITDVKLDYKDVLIQPKRSALKSRKDVDLKRTYKFRNSGQNWSGIPIMAANMDGVGTFDMASTLSDFGMFTCITKQNTPKDWYNQCFPSIDRSNIAVSIGTNLEEYENSSSSYIQQNCMNAAFSKENKEVVGLNFTLFDDGNFEDIDEGDLLFEDEVDYYDGIITDIQEKIKNELNGNNPYDRKETKESRRFIYHSDTCISLAHFLIRDDSLDCKFFLRSSNVKNTLYHDINFLKHMSKVVYEQLDCSGKFCRMNFILNSAHILVDYE